MINNTRKQESVNSDQRVTHHLSLISHHSRFARGFTSTSEGDRTRLRVWFPSAVEANPRQSRGFTLLIAVLVGSVLLALGVAIYNIATKDIVLSSSGRESQFAFYAADSGTECALYWDYQQNAFATTSALTEIECGEETVPLTRSYDPVTGDYRTTFSFSLGTATVDPCSSVEVTKIETPIQTTIVSSGYNTCVTTNPRRIERAIRVQY